MTENAKRRAPAVERAVQLLDCLAAKAGPVGVSELAREVGAPKSSVYGVCESLVATGVLHYDSRGYSLGSHCLRWSGAYLQRSSLVSEFQRALAVDRRLADYTVTLSSLEADQVVYLACRNSDKPLGFTFQIGMRLPAVYSATGKAMLSYVSPEERAEVLSGAWPQGFTTNSVPDRDHFEADIETWRAKGYAIDNGEIREGMVCLGAPILGPGGLPVAGIAISMTSAEARQGSQDDLGRTVREIANALALHYTG